MPADRKQKKNARVSVHFAEAELRSVKRAARSSGLPLATWLRSIAVVEAAKEMLRGS